MPAPALLVGDEIWFFHSQTAITIYFKSICSIPLSLRSKRAFPATALEWKCALRIEMRDHERQTAYSLPPSLSKPEYFKDDAPMTDTGKGGRGEGPRGGRKEDGIRPRSSRLGRVKSQVVPVQCHSWVLARPRFPLLLGQAL